MDVSFRKLYFVKIIGKYFDSKVQIEGCLIGMCRAGFLNYERADQFFFLLEYFSINLHVKNHNR